MLKSKYIRSGQARPYADSVNEWEIVSDGLNIITEAELFAYCQTLQVCRNRDDAASHTGACDFPFGMDAFCSLKKIGDKVWRYIVTEPYTG